MNTDKLSLHTSILPNGSRIARYVIQTKELKKTKQNVSASW